MNEAAVSHKMVNHIANISSRSVRIVKKTWRGGNVKIIIGGIIFIGLVVTGIFAPYLSPHNPLQQNLEMRLRPPAWIEGGDWENILGTDNLGRDLMSRIIFGSRISLFVGVISVMLSAAIGCLLGGIAGYFGRYMDEVIMKVVEVFQAFPFLLLAIVIMAFLGQGVENMILALVLSRWVPFCRMVRGDVLALKERVHVLAARAIGGRDFYIIRKHIIPNAIHTITVMITFSMALMIIYEASLSFLGLGVPPAIPTWGSILSEGRSYMHRAPWLSIIPGMAIFISVLGINLLGDGLRDVMDPRLKKQRRA